MLLLVSIFLLVNFIFKPRLKTSEYQPLTVKAVHKNGQAFVGSENCIQCHAELVKLHWQTAHFKSSALADINSVKAPLKESRNRLDIDNGSFLILNHRKGQFFEETYETSNKVPKTTRPIDMVIGSGTKGQTYLTWSQDSLYQLHLSYFSETNQLIKSPGTANLPQKSLRRVNTKCLECHTTFVKSTALYGMGNTYDRNQMLLGIDCERCHGPAKQHLEQLTNPNQEAEHNADFIQYGQLSRAQRMDMCALCHSGIRVDKKPPFEFLVGDKLNDFSFPQSESINLQEADVHGNQHLLLTNSACFEKSEIMDCTTCHNPHKNQRGQTQTFNQKCMECHDGMKNTECSSPNSRMPNTNCINCHMPLLPSTNMFVETGLMAEKRAVKVRSHWIKVYADSLIQTK